MSDPIIRKKVNARYLRPVAITRAMIEAGKEALDIATREDANPSDDEVVATIFFGMWNAYWHEMEEVAAKKRRGLAVVQKPKLIMPKAMN